MKKILIVTHTLGGGGGAEKILNLILKNINKKKYNIDVLEIKNFGLEYEKIEGINYLGYIRTNQNFFKEIIKDKFYLILLVIFPRIFYNYFIKKEYNIKISFNYLLPSFFITCKKDNSKKICWNHGTIENLEYTNYRGVKKIMYYFLNKLQKRAFKEADKIIAISKKTKESIENVFPDYKEKIKVINNGFDFGDFLYKDNLEKENYIIGIGRLEKGKNFELALKVMDELINQRKINIKLQILGEGEERKNLEAQIKLYNLEKFVELKGYIKNPQMLIKNAKLMIVTSLAEGFPTVIVESLSLKTPVISTPVAGTEELLFYKNEKCGEISTYEVEDIANRIEKLLKDKEVYIKYQETGYLNVKNFSVERQIEQIEELFES